MDSLIEKISTVKLTRKEFLVYVGTIFVGILGIPAFLELISKTHPVSRVSKSSQNKNITSFGSGAYGV